MKIQERVEMEVIQKYLFDQRSGVVPNTLTVPGFPGEHRCYRGILDADDVNRLILWWEFHEYTVDGKCSLTGLLPPAASLPRVSAFTEGDPSRGVSPLDLTGARNMALVLLTNDLLNDWLYIIDGNNRAIAQAVRDGSFQDVPVLVCAHPAMHKWACIPAYYKKLWNRI